MKELFTPAGNIAQLAEELAKRRNVKMRRYFPDEGPYRRELYRKHIAFFNAGAIHRERLLIAANRVGKTDAGCLEVTFHTTGLYPSWWEGRVFTEPVNIWACGDTGKTVRDIIQEKLLGPVGRPEDGFIPPYLREHTARKQGIADAVETIWVKHVTGGISSIQLKSYDQRREAFQGTQMHAIWLDEEPPDDIYTECVLRTAKTSDFPGGIVFMTFTPLQGMTKLVQDFMKEAEKYEEGTAHTDDDADAVSVV
jgi:phage terminase large subunit-like protein